MVRKKDHDNLSRLRRLGDGPDLYFDLMRGNAEALRNCLQENS